MCHQRSGEHRIQLHPLLRRLHADKPQANARVRIRWSRGAQLLRAPNETPDCHSPRKPFMNVPHSAAVTSEISHHKNLISFATGG